METRTARRRWLPAVAILLCGCESAAVRHPDVLYDAAEKLRREGNWLPALAKAEQGIQGWSTHRSSGWYWKFRLLNAEVLLAQGRLDLARPLLESAPAEAPRDSAMEARRLADSGQAAYIRGKYPEATNLLNRALALVPRDAPGVAAGIRIWRASVYIRQAKFADAEQEVKSALAASQHDSYLLANASGTRGLLLLNQNRFDEAVGWFERTAAIAESRRYDAVIAPTLNNLGWCYFRLGDFNKAVGYLTRAVALSSRMQKRISQQIALGLLGDVRYSLRDYKSAVEYYRQALAVSDQLHEDFWKAKWLSNLASTLIDAGDLAAAETYNRRALEIQTQRKDQKARLWPMLNAARIATLRHDSPRADAAYREILASPSPDPPILREAHAGLAELYMAGNQPAKALLEFERANQNMEDRRAQLLNDESKLTLYGSLFDHYRRYVDFLMDQHQPGQALALVESRRAHLLADKMNSRGAVPRVSDFRGLAGRLNAVLLSYWLSPSRSYVWIATPAGARSAVLPPEPEIRALVDRYLSAVHDLRDPLATGQPAARQLYSMLIGPVADLIPSGARVILAPDGCLHRLNFEMLLTPAGYWIEDVTVQQAPSLALLAAPTPAHKAPHAMLLVGNPQPKDAEFPALPAAAQEIREIEHLFPDTRVLTRSDASLQGYRGAKAEDYRIIHFAAHAVANQSAPLDSAVILSPQADEYKLYAREVKDSNLSADLVTISACRSAGARAYSGEGPVGFAWAFLSAGARHVVASLWDVNDVSTSALMADFYRRLRDGQSAASALRGAKLGFIHSDGSQRKPYYWAAFQLYGR